MKLECIIKIIYDNLKFMNEFTMSNNRIVQNTNNVNVKIKQEYCTFKTIATILIYGTMLITTIQTMLM